MMMKNMLKCFYEFKFSVLLTLYIVFASAVLYSYTFWPLFLELPIINTFSLGLKFLRADKISKTGHIISFISYVISSV